jgi:hypothetical protein
MMNFGTCSYGQTKKIVGFLGQISDNKHSDSSLLSILLLVFFFL